jgi:hypothetical protein
MILFFLASLPGKIVFHFPYLLPVKHRFSGIDGAFLPVTHFPAFFIILNSPPRIYFTLLQVALIFPVCAFYNLPAGRYVALLRIKGIDCTGTRGRWLLFCYNKGTEKGG